MIEDEYLGRSLTDGPEPLTPTSPGDHIGVHAQKDGRFYIGAAPAVGRVNGELLLELADLIEAHGSQRLRTTPHQKIVVLDVAAEKVESLKRRPLRARPDPSPSVFRRSTMACTGIEFCKLSFVETKSTGITVIGQLEEALADVADQLPERLTLNINGCPNSCARIQVADIGLKGQLMAGDDGEQTPATKCTSEAGSRPPTATRKRASAAPSAG